MRTYPISLIGLEKRRVVVIGGGQVAARKVEALTLAGAKTEVISPEFCDSLQDMGTLGDARLVARPYQKGDLQGAFLAIAATDDPATNQAVWEEAVESNCLVNVVDDPEHCTFIVPAVIHRGEATIAISTGGSSPALARRLKEKIETVVEPEVAGLAQILGELRQEIKDQHTSGQERLEAALMLIDSDLLEVIREEGMDAGREHARRLLTGKLANVKIGTAEDGRE